MSSPITFATEAERVKAREQFCHTANAIWSGDAQEMPNFYAEQFDSRFPPIAPPKMDAFDAWLEVDDNGESYGQLHFSELPPMPTRNGRRVARVRVVEVDDE